MTVEENRMKYDVFKKQDTNSVTWEEKNLQNLPSNSILFFLEVRSNRNSINKKRNTS